MRRKIMQLVALVLAIQVLIPAAGAAKRDDDIVRVGLAYGNSAAVGSNLENNTGYGAGYQFGYYDSDLDFVPLAETESSVTRVTVLKAQNTWFTYTGGKYVYDNSDNGGKVVGCFHIRLPGTYMSVEDAATDAAYYGGYVAWIDGSYQVRVGNYTTKAQAEDALASMNQGTVVGTSSYAVTVVQTGTNTVLFQFDGGSSKSLGIMPDVTGASEVRTWCMGFRRNGGFRYERINGGNLTVANLVDMETYIKGVIPYEMNNAWPLEALKTQAVCARSYAKVNISESKHSSSHIDVCDTADCQVYNGVGSNKSTYQANATTDQAVDETAGMYAWYKGSVIPAYYSSCHGGASEDIYNVWGSSRTKYPYLCGVIDPYEQGTSDINPNFTWKVSYTSSELTTRLRNYGYCVGTSLSSIGLTYSPTGNVILVKLNYANGQSNTLKVNNGIRSVFGVKAIRFTINGVGASSGVSTGPSDEISVNGNDSIDLDDTLYAITGSGTVSKVDEDGFYAITGTGKVDEVTGEGGSDTTTNPSGSTVTIPSASNYVFNGGGYGHQLGMSQYGAYAMALKGFDYDEIVTFYYPGTYVSDEA